MFVTNCISTTKIQKISEITNFLGTISYPELRSDAPLSPQETN